MFFPPIEMAPADPILGLTEAFRKDPRATKVNLGVGVFVDDKGTTPVLECIRRAERLLWETEKTKGYTPINGPAEYGEAVAHLVFGRSSTGWRTNSVAVAQTPGGTGALRVGAELLKAFRPQGTVWMPNPTWGNHKAGCLPPPGWRRRAIRTTIPPRGRGCGRDVRGAGEDPRGRHRAAARVLPQPHGRGPRCRGMGAGGGHRGQGRLVPVL
jgi:hypothetical protein